MAGIMRAIQTVVLVIFPPWYSGFLTCTTVEHEGSSHANSVMLQYSCSSSYLLSECHTGFLFYSIILSCQLLPSLCQMTACLPFKMPYNPKNANTTNSQCFSIKARDRNDFSGHCLYLVVKSQHSPQGNDALNVSYFLAWWWIRMSQACRLKKFPKASDAWNAFYI